jgi:hypothetical protein
MKPLTFDRSVLDADQVASFKSRVLEDSELSGGFVLKISPKSEIETLSQGGSSPIADDQKKAELTQTERDFILAQIIKYWRFNYETLSETDLTLNGNVTVLANGMLAAPFNGNQPWSPETVLPQYKESIKTKNWFAKDLLESFYLALRLSQPLDLPPGSEKTWPRLISVSFRLKDLPKRTDIR